MRRTRTSLPFIALAVSACAGTADDAPVDTDTDTDALVVLPDTGDLVETDEDTGDSGTPIRRPCSASAAADLSGWCDLSVNKAAVEIPQTTGDRLRLTLSGDNTVAPPPSGAFNGPGRGNRALAGLHQVDGTRLDTIAPLALQDRAVSAPPALTLDLLLRIDPTCDGAEPVVLVIEGDRWFTTEDQDWNDRTLPSDRAAFYAYGGLPAADAPAVTLVDDPLAPGRQPTTLDAILADWPDACLENGSTTEASLPPGQLSAVMLSLGGDLSTSDVAFWDVRSFTLGSATWASP